MLRIRDTAIVASAAISLTKHGDPVFVANTTKYGMELQRKNDWGRGSATCDANHRSCLQNQATYGLTAQLNGIERSDINGISSQDSVFIAKPSTHWKSASGWNNTGASNLEGYGEIPSYMLQSTYLACSPDPSDDSQTAVIQYAISSSSTHDCLRESPVGVVDENVRGISSPGRDPRGSSKLNSQERRERLFKLDVLGFLRTFSASRMVDRASGIVERGMVADEDKNTCRCFLTVGLLG